MNPVNPCFFTLQFKSTREQAKYSMFFPCSSYICYDMNPKFLYATENSLKSLLFESLHEYKAPCTLHKSQYHLQGELFSEISTYVSLESNNRFNFHSFKMLIKFLEDIQFRTPPVKKDFSSQTTRIADQFASLRMNEVRATRARFVLAGKMIRLT